MQKVPAIEENPASPEYTCAISAVSSAMSYCRSPRGRGPWRKEDEMRLTTLSLLILAGLLAVSAFAQSPSVEPFQPPVLLSSAADAPYAAEPQCSEADAVGEDAADYHSAPQSSGYTDAAAACYAFVFTEWELCLAGGDLSITAPTGPQVI